MTLALTFLQLPTRLQFEDGVTPVFYSNKVTATAFSSHICLNPLEYYLFLFCHKVQSSSTMNARHVNEAIANPSNLAYVIILESYLKFFLPVEPAHTEMAGSSSNVHHSHSIWESLSSTTSNILHGNRSVLSHFQHSPQSPSVLPKSSLLNMKFLQNTTNAASPSSLQRAEGMDILGSQIWKSETFINIFTEMLLNVSLTTAQKEVDKIRQSPNHINAQFPPTSDQVRAVRIFIKHLHFFANSAPSKECSPNPQMNMSSSPYDELKRNVLSGGFPVQHKLYGFLKLCFEKWPCDASFRLPLETWLSYIQPWRYTNVKDLMVSSLDGEEKDSNVATAVDSCWKPFIASNLFFYSNIFRQVISRFDRLDLVSIKNALMLHRVVKVFSLPNLREYIREAEIVLEDPVHSWTSFANSKGSLLTPNVRASYYAHPTTAGLPQQLLNYESPDFAYSSLYGADQIEMTQFVKKLRVAKAEISDMIIASTPTRTAPNETFLGSLKEMFVPSNTRSNLEDQGIRISEYKRTENFINQCIERLSLLFEISLEVAPNVDAIDSRPVRRRHMATPTSPMHEVPECILDQHGTPCLTERGREQVLNRIVKPSIHFEGNPDRQPCRTYELEYLVRFWLFISDWLNNTYGDMIRDIYFRDTIVGGMVRATLSRPVTFTRVVKKGLAVPPERIVEQLPPRIQLRFLANKFLVIGWSIISGLFYLLGYSQIKLPAYGLVLFLLYALVLSLLGKTRQLI